MANMRLTDKTTLNWKCNILTHFDEVLIKFGLVILGVSLIGIA